QGSAVFFDPKRENFAALANHRAAMGDKVFMFSPSSTAARCPSARRASVR
ncbi:hypothetical protein GR255_26185, partial [Mycobacterium tuberculosis]|nr:hypothetical protein [Mycobacterium tuberculosis]